MICIKIHRWGIRYYNVLVFCGLVKKEEEEHETYQIYSIAGAGNFQIF